MVSNKPLPKVSRQFAEAKDKGGVVIYLDGNRTIYDQCTMEDLIVSNGIVQGENVMVSINHIVSIERI